MLKTIHLTTEHTRRLAAMLRHPDQFDTLDAELAGQHLDSLARRAEMLEAAARGGQESDDADAPLCGCGGRHWQCPGPGSWR